MANLHLIRNWEIAKHLILRKWDKIKENELTRIPARFEEVVALIHTHYNEPKANIESELKNLIDQIDR